ncbi:unnamed protein product [Closterium sp. NIES-65]|nr:unnamed protein product [Closterium sp. NIES-65]
MDGMMDDLADIYGDVSGHATATSAAPAANVMGASAGGGALGGTGGQGGGGMGAGGAGGAGGMGGAGQGGEMAGGGGAMGGVGASVQEQVDEETRMMSAIVDQASTDWQRRLPFVRLSFEEPQKPGHYIKHCPTNGDPAFDVVRRVRPPSGIPKSFLRPDQGGGYLMPDGSMASMGAQEMQQGNEEGGGYLMSDGSMASMGAQEMQQGSEQAFARETEPFLTPMRQPQAAEVPPELKCPLCSSLFRNAVLIPCCHLSFCDQCEWRVGGWHGMAGGRGMGEEVAWRQSEWCSSSATTSPSATSCSSPAATSPSATSVSGIRQQLLAKGSCPKCSSTLNCNDDLLPNMTLRQAVDRFKV